MTSSTGILERFRTKSEVTPDEDGATTHKADKPKDLRFSTQAAKDIAEKVGHNATSGLRLGQLAYNLSDREPTTTIEERRRNEREYLSRLPGKAPDENAEVVER